MSNEVKYTHPIHVLDLSHIDQLRKMMFQEPNKMECYYIIEMLDSRLINYRHTHPWAETLITLLNSPPPWLLEVSLSTYQLDQIKAIRKFIDSEPFLDKPSELYKFHIGCLWLRYEQRALSWATLLENIGVYLDSAGFNDEWDCSFPYHYLNEHEISDYSELSEIITKKDYLEEHNIISWLNLAKQKSKPFFTAKSSNATNMLQVITVRH